MLLLAFAFLSGIATILAPCIWPLLPIILSSSIAGRGKARPAGITLGIMLSFTVFTLAISALVKTFHIDPNVLRTVAVVIIAFLGVVLIIPSFSKVLELWVSKLSGRFGSIAQTHGTDFVAGFITGLSLGIVWAPCAGPILATIAALAITGQVTRFVVALTISYVTGIGVPLFLIAYGGQQLLARSRRLSQYTGRIQQVFGVVMILTALAIYTNYDKVLQLKILNVLPSYSNTIGKIENNSFVKDQLNTVTNKTSSAPRVDTSGLFNINVPAPEIVGSGKWLNSSPLTLASLRGKVVLVDFWTYTCINCIRTLPHVTGWYDKYKDQGFVVVGVHTPEFEFEKKTENVAQAINQYRIHYPVAQDNDYATWNNYSNQYWPAEYLIDANGNIRRVHFGEGKYEETEQAIQALLAEAGKTVTNSLDAKPDQTPTSRLSPESYLGAARMEYEYPAGSLAKGKQTFALPKDVPVNAFSFGGEWQIDADKAVAGNNASLLYRFNASKVFLVLRPGANPKGIVQVFLDGALIGREAGADVKNGLVTIDTDRLYNLVDLHSAPGEHTLLLKFESPGVEAFAFTFG